MGVNERVNKKALTSIEIIRKLKNLKDLNFNINDEWLIDLTLTEEQLDGIISCINNCTSPKKEDIFKAFSLFKPNETRVLILGQDPYPDDDQYRINHYGRRAHGLAFSFLNSKKDEGKPEPAADSLENIFKAIAEYKNQSDDIYTWNTNLETWASTNKILLLNTALTFESENTPHFEYWNDFIKNIIKKLIQIKIKNKCKNLAIFLWGKEAQTLFSQSLNLLNDEEKEIFKEIEILKDNRFKNSLHFKKIKNLIKNKQVIQKSKENIFCLYMTSHPSNNYKSVEKGFYEDAPNHFKACDEFLGPNDNGKYIFKNFPENNQ